MIIARYILSLAILLFAAYIAAMNWGCVIVSMRNRRRGIDRYHSTVPGFSFFVAVIALVLFPRPVKAVWMMAVPLLDIANLNLLLFPVCLPVMLIRDLRKKRGTEPGTGGNRR